MVNAKGLQTMPIYRKQKIKRNTKQKHTSKRNKHGEKKVNYKES